MARTKVRKFDSCEVWSNKIRDYVKEHKSRYVNLLLKRFNCETEDDLYDMEYEENAFGFDCGWVNLVPIDKDMQHEWFLDNDRIPDRIWDPARFAYNTQSTILKEVIVQQLIQDMNLEDIFAVEIRLD